MMNRRKTIVFGAALWVAAAVAGASTALAQTSFQNYRCADGAQFIVGFFQYDKRAHMQIDGKAVTLGKRLAVSGSRYTGGGVTLTITKAGARLQHAKRPVTACEVY
jgi:membrane-bound inhibitor of C-type lysozyme